MCVPIVASAVVARVASAVVDRLGHWAESLDVIVFRTTYVRT